MSKADSQVQVDQRRKFGRCLCCQKPMPQELLFQVMYQEVPNATAIPAWSCLPCADQAPAMSEPQGYFEKGTR